MIDPPARSLAIETSGKVGSIALVESGKVVAEETFAHGLQHAARIISVIDEHTRRLAWTPRDLHTVFVSTGPGSFTGLRIGITVAKTLAYATGAKLVAVPSLRVLVHNAPEEASNVIIVLDAKRGQIFTARFERAGDTWNEIEPPHVDRLHDMLQRAGRPVWLLGEGLPYHQDAMQNVAEVHQTSPESWQARSSVVAEIGQKLAAENQFVDPHALEPVYIGLAEAQEKWEAGQVRRSG